MDRMDFTHAVARIRVMEKRLLNTNIIEKLIDSDSAEEVLRVLQDTTYGSNLNDIQSVYEYEKLLRAELVELYKNLYKISPIKEVIDVMTIKYDYHNIKVLIKEKALGKDFSTMIIPIGTLPLDLVKTCILTSEYKPIDKHIGGIIQRVKETFEETKDPQSIDILLDKYMFEDMLSIAEKLNTDFITRYVKESIDITNIKTMLRVKKQDKDGKFLQSVIIPGGTLDNNLLITGLNEGLETFIGKISRSPYAKVLTSILEEYSYNGSISSLEVLYDNYIMNHARDAKRINFGPEPIIAYIIAKETEIKIVRIIMVGKVNKVDVKVIRERLREVYV